MSACSRATWIAPTDGFRWERTIADPGFDDALLIVPFGVPEMLDEIRDLLP